MLLVDIISTRASSCASSDSGTWTGHLVAVEVRVEGGADERMQLDRFAFDQHRLERLNAQAVQCRRAVQQHRMFADDLFEDIPDLRLLFLTSFLDCLTVAENPFASSRA
jgi:hypothetical protein